MSMTPIRATRRRARKKQRLRARQVSKSRQSVPILAASPDRGRFSCLDHIHMTEPYHRLMAKEWLRVILKEPLSATTK